MDLSADVRREPSPDLGDIGQDEGLAERIRAEIAAVGPLTFVRFMELALYDAEGGYYRGPEARPGRAGDFLTAPEAHPIYGHALSRQLDEIWVRLGRPDPFVIHEHGAGTGALAEAILRGLETDRSALVHAIRYVPLEIEARRTEALATRLAGAGFARALDPLGDQPVIGVVLANEVLDALPVHRVAVRGGRLLERFVGLDGSAFVDTWGAPSTPALAERLTDDGATLAEGQSAEICLGLDGWVDDAVRPLKRGLLLVIDYGATAAELYDPARRPNGTLRAFVRHRVHDGLYLHVGRQDLTSHVDLTALDAAAKRAGLDKVGATSQAEFIVGNGAESILRAVQADPATTLANYVELRSALVRLIDPAGMGGFRVVAFGRDWPAGPPLAGLAYRVPGR